MRQRVIIENVKPEIDGGIYYIKRVPGERVDIQADIYGDGHDTVRAQVCYKHAADKEWTEAFLEAQPNDVWTGHFTPDRQGMYHYKVIGWIDHFANWHHGFVKKYEASQDLTVELQEGVELIRQTAAQHPKAKAAALLQSIKILENKKGYQEAVAHVVSSSFEELVHAFPFKQHVSEYDNDLRVRVERPKTQFSAWYELFPRSASDVPGKHGTFKDVEKLLPRIAEMGFDVLYLPPIHPIGKINRKGKNNSVTAEPGEPGSPWAIGSDEGGHKSIHPELGTLKDYVRLIKEARKHNIEIALDLALQCAPDHPYIKEHPQWFKWRPDGSIMYAENPPKKYQDIVPIYFETEDWKNLWEELRSIVLYWVEQGVHIFRVDNPHTKPFPFWEWVIAEVYKVNPDIIFLAEAFTRPKIMGNLAKLGYNQSYTYFTWRETKKEIEEYMTELTQTESREYYNPNFWPNTPDILPFHLQGKGSNAFFLRLALAATLSSNYGVYNPAYEICDNRGFLGKEEYFDSEKYEIKPYNWKTRNRMTDLMTRLNQIRRENAALQSTWNIRFVRTDNEQLISYIKYNADRSNIIWCIANLDPEQTVKGFVEVPRDVLGIQGRINIVVEDLLVKEHYTWKQDRNYVELNPDKSPIHIFKVHIFE